ncbi:hypothetical protein M3Y98_00035500 [Aphelenchoides besseyi]|nr:hypothetical protein M3Y98_00035500 [Aphelenchoides besseyi]
MLNAQIFWTLEHVCSQILIIRWSFTLGLAFKTVSKTPPKQHLQTHCDPHVSTFSPREIIGSTILSFLNIYAYFGYARGHSSDPFFTKMLHHVNNFKLDRSTTDSIPMLYSKNIDLTAKAEAVAIMLMKHLPAVINVVNENNVLCKMTKHEMVLITNSLRAVFKSHWMDACSKVSSKNRYFWNININTQNWTNWRPNSLTTVPP